jgi:GNAT superfamily N-acetyltransferase
MISDSNLTDYVISRATPEEWKQSAVKWGNQLQWNLGQFDTPSFFRLDADGFFVGKYKQQIVACVSGVRHGTDKGFIGFYIVREDHRKRGFGLALFRHAMEHLKGRIIGLDAVREQIPNYIKSGFSITRWNARHSVVCGTRPLESISLPDGYTIIDNVSLDEFIAIDQRVSKITRSREFMDSFKGIPQFLEWGVCDKEGKLVGYMAIRPATNGYRVGPWYGDSLAVAYALMNTALSRPELNGTTLWTDLAIENADAAKLAKLFQMGFVVDFARMWTSGSQILEDLNQLYAVMTLESG